MDLSILIVNWNTCQYLRQCIRSIEEGVEGIEHEVIVVDNASGDGSAEMVRREFPWVRLVASPENLGFARGNNLALALSRGRHILVLNPDIVLKKNTVKELIQFTDLHPDAGVVSPKFLNPDGSFQGFFGRIPTLTTVLFLYTRIGTWIDRHLLRGRMRRRERYGIHEDFNEVLRFTDGGAGLACTLVPRAVIEALGFLDERFPVFFNDGDFARRLFDAGYKAYVIPNGQVLHHGGSSVRQLERLHYDQEFVYGLRAYSRKHRGMLYNRLLDLVLGLDPLLETIETLGAVLLGRARPASLGEPFARFRRILSYRPPNARPGIGRPSPSPTPPSRIPSKDPKEFL